MLITKTCRSRYFSYSRKMLRIPGYIMVGFFVCFTIPSVIGTLYTLHSHSKTFFVLILTLFVVVSKSCVIYTSCYMLMLTEHGFEDNLEKRWFENVSRGVAFSQQSPTRSRNHAFLLPRVEHLVFGDVSALFQGALKQITLDCHSATKIVLKYSSLKARLIVKK